MTEKTEQQHKICDKTKKTKQKNNIKNDFKVKTSLLQNHFLLYIQLNTNSSQGNKSNFQYKKNIFYKT